MKDIQEIFNRMQETKKEMKDLRQSYKDALASSHEYVQLVDEMKTMRERKKSIESAVKETCMAEIHKLEDLKIDLESDKELISDIAMSQIMKGESIQITDQYDNEYEPKFSVAFKKA